ncbi:putative pentatricopeptide repeat-containing protein At1g68930 [Magnolia sinica]|uniref:putative pentatricopeptide repeat-containing protein At1g68930 n=1 Tax=Magnolia sinica TaxID=86752 RepID=UPI002657DC70|nr:putative pentatricopeptide repeat-containing protein At1g68930 [Magnolia sinica]
MDRSTSPIFGSFRLAFVLILLVVGSAQELGFEETDNDNQSNESRYLDRRSKISLSTLQNEAANEIDVRDLGIRNTISRGNSEPVGLGIFDAFFTSLSMILVSEIGDETFIIAALMAMRHPKSIVLSGALSALVIMTVLSTGLGRIVPNLISRKHTNSAATVLYAFFGLRLLYIAWRSDSKTSQKKEMEEVEEKLEAGQGKTTFRRYFSRFCTPIFLESFILTFLAEWGDRSQIATIALATHKNALGVAVGATVGHTICTSIAVVGGSMLASKISQGTVAAIGGLLFLCFSLSSYFYPPMCYFWFLTDCHALLCLLRVFGSLGQGSSAVFDLCFGVTGSGFLAAQPHACAKPEEDCDKLDQRAINTMQLYLVDEVLYNVIDETTTSGLWVKMESIHMTESLFNRLYLKRQFYNIKMTKGLNIFEHINIFNKLVCKLKSVEVKINEEDKALILLTSLLVSYEYLVDIPCYGRYTLGIDIVITSIQSKQLERNIGGECRSAHARSKPPYRMPLPKPTVALDVLKFPRLLSSSRQAPLPTTTFSTSSIKRFLTTIKLNPNDHLTTLIFQSSYHSPSFSAEIPQESFFHLLRNAAKTEKTLSEVQVLHCRAIKTGFEQNPQVGSCLSNLYVRCRCLDHAGKLFDGIPNRDVRAWTVQITGYARIGLFGMAVDLFSRMQTEGVLPNCFTLSCVLKGCAGANFLKTGKEIHGWILRNRIGLDVVLENTIIDFYVKCGVFDYARRVFEMMDERDTVSWNIMIGAYLQIGDIERSVELFKRLPFRDVASWNTIMVGQMRNGFVRMALELLYQMGEIGPKFNQFTFSVALVLVSSLSMLGLGRQIHGHVLRIGFESDLFIRNSLIDMYCKCGKMEYATAVFDKMYNLQNPTIFHDGLTVNAITWSSMITGYVQNGRCEDALNLFCHMLREGIYVDPFTLTSIASACADAGILEQGRQIHASIEKRGHRYDAFLASAIIDMYAKCGSLDDAQAIFYRARPSDQSVVLWTAIVSGCALHGRGREAIRLFELMLKENIQPNEISFVGVLSACSHAGLVEEGHAYFKSMQEDYGIVPDVEHFTCMVDLLSRAGRLDEAKDFIHKNGISHLNVVWRALLSACRVHNNIEMGKWASEQLLQLEPFDAGSYILLSNIYATTQRWAEAAKVRSLMQVRGVKKHPGQSWIQLKNQVHTFLVGDWSHPQAAELYSYLEKLIGRMKEVGYSTNTNLVLHDVEEEQREVLISYHSEKLAVAYGIMSTPCGTPIRVMKNLRVCGDCHTAIKYISEVTDREIMLRDAYRFHHFKNGSCSCRDYW